jgi:hypothetical protein
VERRRLHLDVAAPRISSPWTPTATWWDWPTPVPAAMRTDRLGWNCIRSTH